MTTSRKNYQQMVIAFEEKAHEKFLPPTKLWTGYKIHKYVRMTSM